MYSLTSKSKPISQFLLSQSHSSSPSRILFISLFNTSSSNSSNSHSNQPPSSSSSFVARRHDEESKNVKVSVWWDFENCSVPYGVNVYKISHLITSAVRENGIKGPVQINAFGDVVCLSRVNQEALSSTGVNLIHIPHGGKNSADRSLLVDLMYWVSQNPPPAHIFLISGDKDFAGILHKLRMNNYNILLAGRDEGTHVLCSAASIMWRWRELTKGENLSGRHFNQPPDGPFNSWYGRYRGTLEDPYSVSELQSSSVTASLTSAEESSNSSHHPVPLVVLRQIRRIVSKYPNGVSITELRSELKKNNVSLDKTFYGYNKFSAFLQSMPQIMDVIPCADGQFFLRPASQKKKKPVERNDTSVGSMSEKSNQDVKVIGTADAQSQLPVSPTDHRERPMEKEALETPEKKPLVASQIVDLGSFTKDLRGKESLNEEAVEISVAPKEEQSSESDVGLFKRLWTNLFGASKDVKKTSYGTPVESDTLGHPEVSSFREEETKPTSQYDGAQHSGNSSSSNALNNDAQQPANSSSSIALDEDANSNISDKFEASPGFVTRVIGWCKSWRNSSVRTPTEQSSDDLSLVENKSRKLDDASCSSNLDDDLNSRKHELFTKDTFWSALQSFFKTRRGSDIVSNSASREQLAKILLKEGPLILRPLQESDLHHLVVLLVSEKKWILEFPTQTPRFRFAQPDVEGSSEVRPQNVQPHSSSGLSYIFMNSSSQGNHNSRVSSALVEKPFEKSRSDVLADCQKLLDEITTQYPDGFNLSYFKKLFLEKYGYSLDHQKLGYPKLASLLQIMPGVKVVSSHLYSGKVAYSPGIESLGLTSKSSSTKDNVSKSSQKNDNGDSPWEELGPVAKQEIQPNIGQVNGDYEPSVSDDDEFSELEEDANPSAVKEDQNRSTSNEDDSSLLQILDSWYSTTNETDPRDHGSHADEGLVDCSKKETDSQESDSQESDSQESDSHESSDTSTVAEGSASTSPLVSASAVHHAWKQRPQKSYLFVSDPVETKKDKLIDGILGSLKKSGESRMQG